MNRRTLRRHWCLTPTGNAAVAAFVVVCFLVIGLCSYIWNTIFSA